MTWKKTKSGLAVPPGTKGNPIPDSINVVAAPVLLHLTEHELKQVARGDCVCYGTGRSGYSRVGKVHVPVICKCVRDALLTWVDGLRKKKTVNE